MAENRRVLLVARPQGMLRAEDFSIAVEPLPALADGQFLVRNHYASLDPAMRGWMDDVPSYLPPIPLGATVRAGTIGVVVESRTLDYPVGQWVGGLNGLEDYSVGAEGGTTRKFDASRLAKVTNYLSILGGVGLTAYFGFLEECQPQPGQTLLVSGAAGAVGSLVGQLGKLHGCRVIGIAGGAAKCAKLIDRYGFDAAIDYRGKDVAALSAAIRAAAPDGVDMVFENVGSDILDAALLNLRRNARVALCGLISEYNSEQRIGARNLWSLIVHHAQIRGVLATEFLPRFPEAREQLEAWLTEGKLTIDEHIEEGLENAYPAFMRLFDGSNQGKMILKIA
ncbi:NADP-dependent oxidoreductase [Sphingoaurantiacus capsulatus]|uniref:NADP-dependent oxidoreductase n=1 Tax=Sphingoaurantiacus capsulatus TaxID=1771310 RepID=A0ABV7X9H9_9SPHN